MFNQRVYNDQENYEEPGFNPADFPPSFFPSMPLESFGGDFFPKDDLSFYLPPADFEAFEPGIPFMIDPTMYQSFQEDIKRFIPSFDMFSGFMKDGNIPEIKSPYPTPKNIASYPTGVKLGTISLEERRMKVKKFLEKRKRRIFKKRISYACRKRVADSRVRVKGRFITKQQASALLIDQDQDQDTLKKEEN